MDRLRAAEPEIVFDAATLRTDADWIAGGPSRVRDADRRQRPDPPAGARPRSGVVREAPRAGRRADGTMPYARWVVRETGKVDLGNVACAMCHTRVMPDGTAILGRAGQLPFRPGLRRRHPEHPAAGDAAGRAGAGGRALGRRCLRARLRAMSQRGPARRLGGDSARRHRAPGHERLCATGGAGPHRHRRSRAISTRPDWGATAASPT